MLAHAQVIVGAPDSDFTGAARMMMLGAGKCACPAFKIGEHAVAALAMKTFELPTKIGFVVHDVLPLIVASGSGQIW